MIWWLIWTAFGVWTLKALINLPGALRWLFGWSRDSGCFAAFWMALLFSLFQSRLWIFPDAVLAQPEGALAMLRALLVLSIVIAVFVTAREQPWKRHKQ